MVAGELARFRLLIGEGDLSAAIVVPSRMKQMKRISRLLLDKPIPFATLRSQDLDAHVSSQSTRSVSPRNVCKTTGLRLGSGLCIEGFNPFLEKTVDFYPFGEKEIRRYRPPAPTSELDKYHMRKFLVEICFGDLAHVGTL